MKQLFKGTLIIFLSVLITSCSAQTSIDSTVMQYLRTAKSTQEPVLRITKKNGKVMREANFFIEPVDSLTKGSSKLTAILFGSAASHERKYFLLQVASTRGIENKIIDDQRIDEAVQALLAFVGNLDLSNAEKSVLLRALTFAYN